MTNKQPVQKFRSGAITAAVWEQTGAKGTFHNVTISRSYKDEDGNWKDSDSYGASHLPHVETVIRRAGDFISTQKPETGDAEAA